MPNPTAQRHEFTGLKDWVEIFRAGTHTDSKGKTTEFTQAHLDEIVVNSGKLGAAPAVIGHPKDNDPAYGWARELKREGDSLFAKFADIYPAFEAGVDAGLWRNRSVSVFKDPNHGMRLRHVGFLGAAPPAIDGLQALDYAAEPEAMEFSVAAMSPGTVSYALGDVAHLLRGLRDWVIASAGLEQADLVLPGWRIDSIADAATRIGDTTNDPLPFSAHTGADTMLTQADLDRAVQETEARVRAEMTAAQSSDFTAATTLANTLLRERQGERITGQINGWKAAGKLLPAEEPGLAEFMTTLDGAPGTEAATFEFTAAGTAAKKTPLQFFSDFVANRAALVKLGVTAGQETDPGANAGLDKTDANAIAKAAQEFQAAEAKAGREISIADAVSRVTRNPQAKA